jgi:hypothetical protein
MVQPEPNVPLTTQAPSKRTNVVWRFYVDPHGAWRWQQLGSDHSVLGDSSAAYATYDECVSDAEAHGYRFMPSQKKVGLPARTYTHLEQWR